MKVDVLCHGCGTKFKREQGELNRSERLGRQTYCTQSCQVSYSNKNFRDHKTLGNTENLKPGKEKDEYSPYRWFMARVRHRLAKKGPSDLSVEDLKRLWKDQEGICPYTGWKLILPDSTRGWDPKRKWTEQERMRRASLDRIDSRRGYQRDNIQFVCQTANFAKRGLTEEEFDLFREAIALTWM